ncbi:LysM peptidoglycan-binding domain-containing protein [Thalassotalea sediminis]|uniref:LysM peptidoglycan-binding domain-containing protein n=1 Tax=Thalassotalea sediminis TaxID=1759089 RepID=UPI0025725D9A|nr:LysM peptidoglycan-binding domain-containing protein [Thalassotalea sediminis]
MIKRSLITLICCFLPWSLSADELRLLKDAPKSYVVVKGDTLWDISAKFLKDPWLWPKLWRVNPEIQNPHLIYPGEELNLVYDAQGRPMLVKGKPRLKWSPKVRKSLKEQNPIETISLNTIAPYINYNTVLSVADVEQGPYVLGSEEGYKISVDGFKLYVNQDLPVGHAVAIYDKEDEILSPETEEVLGYYAKIVATGKVVRAGDMANKVPATVYVDNALSDIRSGNFVKMIDEQQLFPAFFTMQPVNSSVKGTIVKAPNKVREFGKFDVVYIDQGSNNNVMLGDILSITRKSPEVVETGDGPVYISDASKLHRMTADSDYNMPEEAIGKLMVFKVFENVSMALVLGSEKPIRLSDNVAAP